MRPKNTRPGASGTLIAPRLAELSGSFLQRGQQIGTVAAMDNLIVRAALDQDEVELLIRLLHKGKTGHAVQNGPPIDRGKHSVGIEPLPTPLDPTRLLNLLPAIRAVVA